MTHLNISQHSLTQCYSLFRINHICFQIQTNMFYQYLCYVIYNNTRSISALPYLQEAQFGIQGSPLTTKILFLLYYYLSNMNIILADAAHKYKDHPHVQRTQLHKFIQTHRFYKSVISQSDLLARIENLLKKNQQLRTRGQHLPQQYQKEETLRQLSLYLNKESNRQIFTLFEHILNNPRGITYDSLSKKLKTDIITVSHYCCKLKKLRLIYWEHEKEGVVVFPKTREPKDSNSFIYFRSRNEPSYDLNESFFFRELNMNENIWINVSGEESIAKGGLTNQEVKRKIMKQAENKMVRRTVQSMKFFDKNAERQGKVFEFKYKNETQAIKNEIMLKNQISNNEGDEEIESLDEAILQWLQAKFPQFSGDNFLLKLINNKFKDYLSILGVKQSKRQCTPLKLNRYIKVLNYIHREGGMRQPELRALIVKDEAKFNVGVMHKRSLMGILEGLKTLGILVDEDSCYYPGWIQAEKWDKRKQTILKRQRDDQEDAEQIQVPKKKLHTENEGLKQKRKNRKINSNTATDHNKVAVQPKKGEYIKISPKRYKFQLLVNAIVLNFQKALNRNFRKSFNRIVYVQRKKTIQKFIPQLNVLHLLESNDQAPELIFQTKLQTFYTQLDQVVEEQGQKQELGVEIENQVIKFIRKNPSKHSNSLRVKYGKNWTTKLQQLQRLNIVKREGEFVRMISNKFLI